MAMTFECLLSLPLGESYGSFDLEKAVCSHGLFMMSPNLWDPSTKTLQRPLRLSDSTTSLTVRISSSSSSLHVLVLNAPHPLSSQDQQFLLAQVARMLRLSDADEGSMKQFHSIHPEAKYRGFGRVFRSPTLFEDMVKCILLCNCQWPRTLSMAKALCQFQLDLKSGCSSSQHPMHLTEDCLPTTPAVTEREPKRRRSVKKISVNLASKFLHNKTNSKETHQVTNTDTDSGDEVAECCPILDPQLSSYGSSFNKIGDFPSPRELASVDADFLAKRCNLGYRAARIVKLARSIIEGSLQLGQLEEDARDTINPSVYDVLTKQLMEIDGFGPFTCANVLVCMGFYQVVPIDSETVRHMKKVHALRCTTNQTVQKHVENLYGKYAPFQFLAYWSELWEFYEKWFGKTSEMPHSSYQLITASNMKARPKKKWITSA